MNTPSRIPAMHLHRGIGIDVDDPVHRHFQWARQLELKLASGASPVRSPDLPF